MDIKPAFGFKDLVAQVVGNTARAHPRVRPASKPPRRAEFVPATNARRPDTGG
jgi:hypothetical protein